MKRIFFEDNFSLRVLLIYGMLINLMCFFSLLVLENSFLNRTYVCTLFVYLTLMSFIISRLYDKSIKIFIKSFIFMIFAVVIIIIVYFLSWNLRSTFLSYFVLAITYLFFISIILKELPFIKLNVFFFIIQLIIFSVTIFLTFFLLGSSRGHDYGLQFLFSVWILFISTYLFLSKNELLKM
jgi:hypothetical protein